MFHLNRSGVVTLEQCRKALVPDAFTMMPESRHLNLLGGVRTSWFEELCDKTDSKLNVHLPILHSGNLLGNPKLIYSHGLTHFVVIGPDSWTACHNLFSKE